jgi:hypothetical protein
MSSVFFFRGHGGYIGAYTASLSFLSNPEKLSSCFTSQLIPRPEITFVWVYVFREQFYLAGGTALALHIGHRTSMDFDFFTPDAFDTAALYQRVADACGEKDLKKTQDEPNTLSVETIGGVKISFLHYPYELLESAIPTEHIRLASILDIGCMKFSAITSRNEEKDYIDLYGILQRIPLRRFVDVLPVKFPNFNVALALKSLVYTEDVIPSSYEFKNNFAVTLREAKTFFTAEIRNLFPLSGESQ